jgi:hypothetical protein
VAFRPQRALRYRPEQLGADARTFSPEDEASRLAKLIVSSDRGSASSGIRARVNQNETRPNRQSAKREAPESGRKA